MFTLEGTLHAYEAELGAKNSQGFGIFEVLKP